MLSLGLLALGAFIGGVIGLFLLKSEDWSNPITGLSAVIAAAVSGAPIAFTSSLVSGLNIEPVIAMYPVGLVLGILSPFLKYAADNLKGGGASTLLGIAHFAGYAAVVGFGLSVFINPAGVTASFARIDSHFAEIATTYSD